MAFGFRMGNVYAGPNPVPRENESNNKEVVMNDVYAGPEPYWAEVEHDDIEPDIDKEKSMNKNIEALASGVYAGPSFSNNSVKSYNMGPVYAGPDLSNNSEKDINMGFVYAGPEIRNNSVDSFRMDCVYAGPDMMGYKREAVKDAVYAGPDAEENVNKETAEYKFCADCGAKLRKEAKFCNYCGQFQADNIAVKGTNDGKRLPYPKNRTMDV